MFARLRARLRGRLRLPRTLKVTREGRYYLGLTFGVGFAAVNTGNNLLFLALGVLLSLIILSGLLSESALRGLHLRLRLPAEARANEATLLGLEITNRNRIFPAIGLRFEAEPGEGYQATPVRLFRLPAGESDRLGLLITPSRRGEIAVGTLRVSTSYPFGIFAKTRHLQEREDPTPLLVWPGRGKATRLSGRERRQTQAGLRLRRGGGEDLHGLRPYREGDEARQIHWRRSLRVGTLLVAERERATGSRVQVILASPSKLSRPTAAKAPDRPGAPGVRLELAEAFEALIRDAASTAEAHLAAGDAVGLEGPDLQIQAGEGRAHRRRLLTALSQLPVWSGP